MTYLLSYDVMSIRTSRDRNLCVTTFKTGSDHSFALAESQSVHTITGCLVILAFFFGLILINVWTYYCVSVTCVILKYVSYFRVRRNMQDDYGAFELVLWLTWKGSHQSYGVVSPKETTTHEETTKQKHWFLHTTSSNSETRGLTALLSHPRSNVLTKWFSTTDVKYVKTWALSFQLDLWWFTQKIDNSGQMRSHSVLSINGLPTCRFPL